MDMFIDNVPGKVGRPAQEFVDAPREPCAIVIFGATGDLGFRKLIPALYWLHVRRHLPDPFIWIGCGRSPMSDEQFRDMVRSRLEGSKGFDPTEWGEFASLVYYRQVRDDSQDSFVQLAQDLDELNQKHCTGNNRIFYLAVPPSAYESIAVGLGTAGLASEGEEGRGWSRLVVEKPFGRDLSSAQDLDRAILRSFQEHQVFRIDHYLAKETVQDLLVFRFANAIFEPLWNRMYIDHVHITAAESLGVEDRVDYYEQAGVLRDMFQNHMMQLLALVAMESPARFDAESVRDEKSKVFKSIRPLALDRLEDSLVLGQYGSGTVNSETVPAYRNEPGVNPESLTPTYAMMTAHVDNLRWQGVPFYLVSGKRLPKKVTEIIIEFRRAPYSMFRGSYGEAIITNRLTLSIQPEERIRLTFQTRNRGMKTGLRMVTMDFDYRDFDQGPRLGAYEKAVLDSMLGDQMLFWRKDAVESCWAFLTPILEKCENGPGWAEHLQLYEAGTWGPSASKALLGPQKRLLA
jgi:glucose-6-phosphate 1-dehydrogenase